MTHIGTFSKTISPALRPGFVVVATSLSERFGELAACLAPAPAATVQLAVARFLREGHYLRHLRRMKRVYAERRQALLTCLRQHAADALEVRATSGMAVVTGLPSSIADTDIALRALPFGMAPVPLSLWYVRRPQAHGLLLGMTNVNQSRLLTDCQRLVDLVQRA